MDDTAIRTYSDPAKVLEKYEEDLTRHIDQRIQLFFTQLIGVYRMPYHFEWIEAQDQYGKGHKYKLKGESRECEFKTQAAHPSTLPCLVAYPRDEWEQYQAGQDPKPEGFVYLKYSNSYVRDNATNELAIYVNQADTAIDGTHSRKRLREKAIKIVNDVALGKKDPQEGVKRFLKQLKHFISTELDSFSNDDPRELVLLRYLDQVNEVASLIKADDGYFDHLLGVHLGDHEREALLRDMIYKKRFRLIQECEAIESCIARDILKVQNQTTGKDLKNIKTVDYRLRYVLLEDPDPRMRRILERLFCTSLEQLQAGIEKKKGRVRRFEDKEKITEFRKEHAATIRKLRRVLMRRFRAMDNAELDYRSHVFKGLRDILNGWMQQKFSDLYQAKYPMDSMSRIMVCRMEQRARPANDAIIYKTPLNQRRKDIGEERALKVADIYEVDPGLFLPAVLSSRY